MGPSIVKFWNKLKGSSGVVLDTMVWIYLFEDHPEWSGICEKLILRAEDGLYKGWVTPVTMAEIMVKPLLANRRDIADNYRSAIMSAAGITVCDIDAKTGVMAGALRAKYRLPLPDMLQCAVALKSSRPILITNDKDLVRVEELDIIMLNQLK